MRETQFISKNQQKWERYQLLLNQDYNDPETLNDIYIEISDDLSYARTFYPHRSVRAFLNHLAMKVNQRLFSTKESYMQRFINFWKIELPQLVWESRWEFIIAFGIFITAFSVGVFSTMIDPDFPRLILGDYYVNMTLENIKKGDPMAVYKTGEAWSSAIGIAAHNIYVSFLTFFSGILASIGTVFMLLYNGVMVGAFQYFFVQKGVFWQSFLAIWLHGTLEISSIVIAGAAGLTLGKGFLFPGTHRRLQAFQRSARRGFKIMAGIVPLFLIAGFVEGVLTRYTTAPTMLRLGFILISLIFIIFYFVWYPYHVNKTYSEVALKDRALQIDEDKSTDWYKIRSLGTITADTFSLFSKYFDSIISWVFGLAIVYAIMSYLLTDGNTSDYIITALPDTNIWIYVLNFPYRIYQYTKLLSISALPTLAIAQVFILSVTGAITFLKVVKEPLTLKNIIFKIIALLLPVSVFQAAFLIENEFVYCIILILLPFYFFWMWDTVVAKRYAPIKSLQNALSMSFVKWALSFFSMLVLLISGGTFYSLADTVLTGFVWEFIQLHLSTSVSDLQNIKLLYENTVGFMCLSLTFSLLLIGSGFIYYAIHEIRSAQGLLERIGKIQLERQLRGLARE